MPFTTFGAIDIGGNRVTLSIYQISKKNGIKRIDQISHILELGKDSYHRGNISHSSMNQLCDILSGFKQKLIEFQVEAYEAYAFSAIREADNAELVINHILVRTGLDVKILGNSEQRFVIYKGIAYQNGDFNKIIRKSTAIVDLGSGSTQITLFDKQMIQVTQNMKIGAVRLTQMLGNISVQTADYGKMIEEYVGNEIDTFKELYLNEKELRNVIVIGEEIQNMIRMVPELKITDTIHKNQFDYIHDKLLKTTPDQLYELYGIPHEIANVLLPAAIIYGRFLEETIAEYVWAPPICMCDGMAVQYAQNHDWVQLDHDFQEDILASARNIAKRYRCNKAHYQHVLGVALMLFDRTKKLHGFGKRERLLLELAGILHECGKYINMNRTLQHSYHIIMATEIIGISRKERAQIANIVYFSGEETPKYENLKDNLTIKEYIKAAKLSVILKISDVIDQGKKQKLGNYQISLHEDQLTLTVETQEDISLEQELFEKKALEYEKIYGICPVLKKKRGA